MTDAKVQPKRNRRSWWLIVACLILTLSLGAMVLLRIGDQLDSGAKARVMRSLVLVCRAYANDYEGKFPENLQDLEDDGFIDQSEIWIMKNEETGENESVYYRQSTAANEQERQWEVILVSPPLRRENFRVLGAASGMVSVERLTPDEVAEAKQGKWPTRR